MCDTFIVTGKASRNGCVLFGKNSDREPNEAQQVEITAAADHSPGCTLRCTYLGIPQVGHTHQALLCRPFWMWGAEMGANEHGVVIGNEAVFTRVPRQKEPALTGMDLLRLALERCRTADDALQTITALLEQYGQGGNCGMTHDFFYDNSFILADPQGGWVLETAGRQWAARRVDALATISNALTIEERWDAASQDLIHYADEMGWHKRGQPFNFRKVYSDRLYTPLGKGAYRQGCTETALRAQAGRVDTRGAMKILRMHGPGNWRADRSLLGAEVCMHAGFGPVRGSQTTGSLVSVLRGGGFTHWVTATAAPCTGVFKPVWLDSGLPDLGPALSGTFNPESLWWRHEVLHREVMRNHAARIGLFSAERDGLEDAFVDGAEALHGAGAAARSAFSRECFALADQNLAKWMHAVQNGELDHLDALYASAWRNWSRTANLPQSR